MFARVLCLCLVVTMAQAYTSADFFTLMLRAITRGSSTASASASSYFLPEPRTTSLPYVTPTDYSVISLSETYSKTREQPQINFNALPINTVVQSEWTSSQEPYVSQGDSGTWEPEISSRAQRVRRPGGRGRTSHRRAGEKETISIRHEENVSSASQTPSPPFILRVLAPVKTRGAPATLEDSWPSSQIKK